MIFHRLAAAQDLLFIRQGLLGVGLGEIVGIGFADCALGICQTGVFSPRRG